MPLIVTSGKPNLCFLIDTGATHNIVFSYVYQQQPQLFSVIYENQSTIIGIDAVKKRGIQIEATLSFEDKVTTAKFSVIDATEAVIQVQKESGVQIHGILGIPFLTQNKWILDFNNLTLQC